MFGSLLIIFLESLKNFIHDLFLEPHFSRADIACDGSFSGVDDNILKPTDVNQSDPKKDIYGTYDKIRFYGYDNTDVDRQTSMKITYKVDGAVMDRTYPIKTKPGDAVKVVGGNLYKLSVTIGNASEDIDFVIEDWIPNTLSVGDIFGEPVK